MKTSVKRACSYCGLLHGAAEICPKKPRSTSRCNKHYVRDSTADAFRSSAKWQHKREEIKKRDGYLCRACLAKLVGTVKRFNPEKLSVHHIEPLSKAWERRLDNGNLITLCEYHHELAESGKIAANILLELAHSDWKYPPGI